MKIKIGLLPRRKGISVFLFYLCCALVFAVLIYLVAFNFASNIFIENNLTSGSDDTTYYTEAIRAANTYRLIDFWGVVEEARVYSGHALGYPLFLFFLFSLTSSIHVGLLCNLIFYSWAATIVTVEAGASSKVVRGDAYRRAVLFLILTPGILLTAMHLFKDILLFALTIYSIYCLQKGFLGRGLIFALITHIFRPYNFILILAPFMLIKFPKSVFVFFVAFGVSYLIDFGPTVNALEQASVFIEFANQIALTDLSSSGSDYTPSGSVLVNYLLGMIRFLMLPLPWVYQVGSNEAVFYFIQYIQSLIVWAAFVLAIVYRKFAIFFVGKYLHLFYFILLHASTYALIYFGNANFRYRIYFFAFIALFIIEFYFYFKLRSVNIKPRLS